MLASGCEYHGIDRADMGTLRIRQRFSSGTMTVELLESPLFGS